MSGFKIDVPNDYFSRIAAKEYSDDAGMAVIREFAQNAADAGATRVEFSFTNGYCLTVRDNGAGCDAKAVRTKLLTPLGSEKTGDAIGGFGKAKELLYFANPAWRIQTRDVDVRGEMLQVLSFETGLPCLDGFTATVVLPPSLWHAAHKGAKRFLACSERPGVEWVLDGEVIQTLVQLPKRAAKDFGFCKAFVDKSSHDSMIYLRTGGLLTATRYGYHGSTVGRVVIELTGKSFELLTPARDWFRSEDHRRLVDGWLNQLVTNARQTLRAREGDEVLFLDKEAVDLEELARQLTKSNVLPTTAGDMQAVVKFLRSFIASGDVAAARDVVPSGAAREAADRFVEALNCDVGSTGPARDIVDDVLGPAKRPQRVKRPDGFDMTLMPDVRGVGRLTVHTGSKAEGKVAMRWLQKNRDEAARALAAWATAVRVVAKQNQLPVDAIGFTFAEGVEAEFVRSNGRFALLLNPMNVDLDASDAAEELLDRALHEAAHLQVGSSHNEEFVLAEAVLRRKTRGALVRGVVNRALRTSAVQNIEEV